MTKEEFMEREISPEATDIGTLSVITRSEIDQQIATAHKFPRSLKRFKQEALEMVTLTERIADECIYSLPRDGKQIEGPSARFAEIVVSAWGNARAGARVVGESGDFVTAQGVFHDLEKNVAIAYEVQRRITDKNGRRYKPDMIGVTGNAACSIALRNAILKGIPKAFWVHIYDAARATIMGDFATLSNRRADALKACQAYGLSKEQVVAILKVGGVEDIGLEEMLYVKGLLTAIKDGDTTVEQLLAGVEETGRINMPSRKPKADDKAAEGAKEKAVAESEPETIEMRSWTAVDSDGNLVDYFQEVADWLPDLGGTISLMDTVYRVTEIDASTNFVIVAPHSGAQKPPAKKAATKKPDDLPEPGETLASDGMRKQVSRAMERAGLSADDFMETYGVRLEKMPANWVNHVLAWCRK